MSRKRKKKRKFKKSKKKNIDERKHEKNRDSDFVGLVKISYKGDAFVKNAEGKEVFVPKFCVNTAMHGDEVAVQILKNAPHKDKLEEGCVTRIINRANKTFTGTVKKDMRGLYLLPDNPKLPSRMEFLDEDLNVLKEHDKVFVEFHSWREPSSLPKVKVKEIIGRAGEHETETKALLLNHHFDYQFPEKTEKYARKLKENISDEDLKEREDFRHKITFTIDPDDAKDFDDAISVFEKEDRYEIGIHIADVTHYVKFNDPIDKEAQKRGTSVYLVDRTIPMLPEVLSNDLCSLNPNEDKRVFSVIFEFSKKDLSVLSYRFTKAIINSNKRFTYKEAQKILDTKEGLFYKELSIIQKIARKLRKERREQGSMDFDSQELEFKLDKNGKVLDIKVKEHLESMDIIEDLMLLANRAVAEFMQKKLRQDSSKIFIYRIHDEPDPEKIEELAIFLKALGIKLKHESGKVDLLSLSKMLAQVKNSVMRATVEHATLRAMAKAVYSHKNIGHFSLGFSDYTHFTSPIRRYPDIMVHRILYAELKGYKLPKEELEKYKLLAVKSSQREIEAMEAERESVKIKQIEYMSQFIGKEFKCFVVGISKNGLFLSEEKTLSEGFLPFYNVPGYVKYDEEKRKVFLPDGRELVIGDSLRATLKSADLEEKRIEWSLQ